MVSLDIWVLKTICERGMECLTDAWSTPEYESVVNSLARYEQVIGRDGTIQIPWGIRDAVRALQRNPQSVRAHVACVDALRLELNRVDRYIAQHQQA